MPVVLCMPVTTRTVRVWSEEAMVYLQDCFVLPDWDVLCTDILRTSIAYQTALRTNFCTSTHPLHPPKQSAASQTTSPGLIDIKSMLIQKKLTLKTQVREDALRIQREPRKKMKEAKNAHWEKAES